MLHYGISSNLSLKTHRVIQTSYKSLESVIYIGNDYATRHPRRALSNALDALKYSRCTRMHLWCSDRGYVAGTRRARNEIADYNYDSLQSIL